MPFFDTGRSWDAFSGQFGLHPFWEDYRSRYAASLAEANQPVLMSHLERRGGQVPVPFPRAARAALSSCSTAVIPSWLPFQLLNALLEIDENSAPGVTAVTNMVHRMIGMRIGTGEVPARTTSGSRRQALYIREIAPAQQLPDGATKTARLPQAGGKQLGFEAI